MSQGRSAGVFAAFIGWVRFDRGVGLPPFSQWVRAAAYDVFPMQRQRAIFIGEWIMRWVLTQTCDRAEGCRGAQRNLSFDMLGFACTAPLRLCKTFVARQARAYSIALPMSSMTFLASPNTIMVLSM